MLLLVLLDAVEVVPSVPVALLTTPKSPRLECARCNRVAGYVLAGDMPAAAKLHDAALACMRARGCPTALKALHGNIVAVCKLS